MAVLLEGRDCGVGEPVPKSFSSLWPSLQLGEHSNSDILSLHLSKKLPQDIFAGHQRQGSPTLWIEWSFSILSINKYYFTLNYLHFPPCPWSHRRCI